MIKKRGTRILLVLLAVVLAVGIAGFAYLSPMLSMQPAPTGEIGSTGILALKAGPNSLFFIPMEDGYILVDAGSGAEEVAQGLPAIGVDPLEVRYVLLTHSDSDHVAALTLFPNAFVCISNDELQLLDGTTKRNLISRNRVPEGVDAGYFERLEDGHELDLGGRTVLCIAAPGHTPGSMAYLLDGRYLFTGDALRVKNGRMQPHPFTMDSAAAKQSIGKLAAMVREDDLIVITAHYGWHEAAGLA